MFLHNSINRGNIKTSAYCVPFLLTFFHLIGRITQTVAITFISCTDIDYNNNSYHKNISNVLNYVTGAIVFIKHDIRVYLHVFLVNGLNRGNGRGRFALSSRFYLRYTIISFITAKICIWVAK